MADEQKTISFYRFRITCSMETLNRIYRKVLALPYELEVDMKIWVKLFFIGIILSALLAACGGSSNTGSENDGIENEEVTLEDLPREVQELIADEDILPDFPLISQLDASPNLVGPGEVVTLNGSPNLYGTVTITHGSLSETIDFSSGSGSYVVPGAAPDGIYSYILDNEEGAIAFGSFRVASAPGIWLDVGGSYVGVEDFIKVRVTAHQVPLDMVAIFRLGDLAQEEFSDDEYDADFELFDPFAFDGPSAYLLPAADSELLLGSLPGVPLSEIVDQTFMLPGRFANQIQVIALDAELAQFLAEGNYEALGAFDEEYPTEGMEEVSNIVSIQQCNLEGEVSGNLGGAGTVRAVSLDGDLVTRTVSTEDGIFSIQLPAGKAFVEGWRGEEEGNTYFLRQAVEVPCGEGVQVSLTETEVSSPRLASLSPAAPLYGIAAQSGSREEICEKIYVGAPGKLPDGFEGADLLTSALAAQLDAELSRASVATLFDIRTLLEQAAQDQWEGGDGQDQLNTVSEILSANIVVFNSVYRVSGKQFASVVAFDKSGGWGAPFARTIIYGETPQELSRLPDSFVEKVQKAGICANIDPVESVIGPNEIVELTIDMTDLDGEAHEQVEISLDGKEPLCGSLEWTEKSIEGTSITNKYTANDELSCADTVVFVGETKGPQGMIKSYPDQGTAKIIKPVLFHFNMTMVFYGEDDGTIDFNWDADFYADENNVVKTAIRQADPIAATGTFTSQNIHCEVHENGVLTFRSEHLNPNATWDIELGGKMEVFENGFVEVRLIPVGTSWNFDMLPFPEECTLLLENILIWFVRTISLQPHNLTQWGAFEFGGLTDQPLKINFPLEGASGFDVTITKMPIQRRQP